MRNFRIGKKINGILTNANINGINNKVFPLIANANTTFPFIVYRRNYFRPSSNKDYSDEIVGIEIVVASTKYEEGIDMANQAADTLQAYSDNDIERIKVTNTYEDFIEDTFIQHIHVDVYLGE